MEDRTGNGGSTAHRARPVPVVVAVVAAVLGVQVLGAALLAVSAREDSRDASLDIARIVADSYAESGATLAQPARSTAIDVASRVSDGVISIDEPGAVADTARGFLLAHPPFTSITVASGGEVVRLERVGQGPEARLMLSWGAADLRTPRVLDSQGQVDEDAPLPPPRAVDLSWIDGAAMADGHPVWASTGPGQDRSGEVVVAVARTGAAGTVVAAVGVSPGALDDTLADGGDDAVGLAYLLTSDGEVVAGPEGSAPNLDATLEPVDGGAAGSVAGAVIFERPVGDEGEDAAPDWTVHVEVSPARAVPAVAAYPRTIALYGGVVAVAVVGAAVALWRIRRPLADLALRARTDPLTGLANRHELEEQGRGMLDAAVRRHATVAVVVLDLDNFKSVNDDVGHDAGDLVLRACAHALALHSGPRDVVARLGGDEFAVMRWIDPGEDASATVERLRAATERDVRAVAPDASAVGVSAGFVATDTSGTFRLEELLSRADAALVDGRRDLKGTTYAAATAP